jgi:hypothetical protein
LQEFGLCRHQEVEKAWIDEWRDARDLSSLRSEAATLLRCETAGNERKNVNAEEASL